MSDARRGLTRPTEQETRRVYKLQTGTGEEGPNTLQCLSAEPGGQ